MNNSGLDKLIGKVSAAAPFGSEAVAEPLEELLRNLNDEPNSEQTESLLEGLRSGRNFNELQRTSDTLIDLGSDNPYVYRQLGQALIEQRSFGLAERTLQYSLDELKPEGREKSEALGLLGRLYKQKFVDSPKETERSEKLINDAVQKYAEAYPLDPAWHGANLVALAARAKRAKITLKNAEEPEEYAAKLLKDLQKTDEVEWTPWDYASAAEASLATRDFDAAKKFLGQYVNFPRPEKYQVNGFMLAGTARQLTEIWEINSDDSGPNGQLLSSLIAASLTQPNGGQVDFKRGELEAFEIGIESAYEDKTLEAIIGDGAPLTIKMMEGLIKRSAFVCQIIDREGYELSKRGTGTGFIVKGKAVNETLGDSMYLLTNNHVLSKDGRRPSVLADDADVLFHNWKGGHKEKRFQIDEIVACSDRGLLDLTLATIKGFPDELDMVVDSFNTHDDALQVDESRVHLIGHPGGHDLSCSVSNNIVKDHNLGDNSAEVNRIHYENPTEKGMSGSPVFSAANLKVVGVHRKGGKIKPIHDEKRPEEGPYQANEAVWAGSMCRAGFGVV